MNSRQKTALWIGIIIIVIMGIYPPWEYTFGKEYVPKITLPGGYWPIYGPPKPEGAGTEIDFSRLLIQWIMVALVTGGTIVTLKDKKSPLPPSKST